MKVSSRILILLLLVTSSVASAHVSGTHSPGIVDRLMHAVLWEEPRIVLGLLVFGIIYFVGRRMMSRQR